MIKQVLIDPMDGSVIGEQLVTHNIAVSCDGKGYDLQIGRDQLRITRQQFTALRELLNSAEILEASDAVQR